MSDSSRYNLLLALKKEKEALMRERNFERQERNLHTHPITTVTTATNAPVATTTVTATSASTSTSAITTAQHDESKSDAKRMEEHDKRAQDNIASLQNDLERQKKYPYVNQPVSLYFLDEPKYYDDHMQELVMENEKLKVENEELKQNLKDLESSQIMLSRRGSMRLLKLVEQQQQQQQQLDQPFQFQLPAGEPVRQGHPDPNFVSRLLLCSAYVFLLTM